MNEKEQKKKHPQQRDDRHKENRQTDKQPLPQPETPTNEVDDDLPTPEEMEAFIRSRREQRNTSHSHNTEPDTSEPVDFNIADNSTDLYTEPDPTIPKVSFKESIYLSRGCNHCPTSYVPISETELRSCCKVGSCNWMAGIRRPMESVFDCVEVRFKNNRKEFFRIPDGIDVTDGDIVAVEGIPGHDVGIVSLTGEACRIQMKKKKVNPESDTIKKLFRRAKPNDIERWSEGIREEENTLKKTRQIAEELGLVMKVNDVEYQGDHSKAIFYYTADDRVDFRDLIKVLAEQFHVRIEMKQIGVRQEAGKVGGLGTCGRELCCSTWLTNFKSVTTSVAKAQQILPNPQKLAGQCGKLKCCLNFEYEVYVDALKKFPPANTALRFQKGLALYKKTDVFRGIMWYAYENENELYAIKADNVKKIIEMNRRQEYPEKLEDYQEELMSTAALAQEASNDEFERELRRMADDNATASPEKKSDKSPRKGDRRDDKSDSRDNRPDRRQDKRQDNRESRPERREVHPERRPERAERREERREEHPERRHDRNDRRGDRRDRRNNREGKQ